MEWIKCSERLPSIGDNVLISTVLDNSSLRVCSACFMGSFWNIHWQLYLELEKVNYWMILPNQPKD